MKTLAIDIETYSSADLKTRGVYKYTEAPDFEILLFGYHYFPLGKKGPYPEMAPSKTGVIDLASGETLPYELLVALTDPYVLKTAHNAAFERTCIAKHFGIELPPDQWECTMAKAAHLGLPLSLDQASKALGIADGKMSEGKKLIRFFSVPCKPTIKNGGRTRNLPMHDPETWLQFKEYCAQDVATEQKIREKISFYEIPAIEKKVWNLDQQINDRGILLDPVLVKNAISFDETFAEKLTKEAITLTGLDNPNSVAQLKNWLEEETGSEVEKLNKETLPTLLKEVTSDTAKRVLQIRQQLSKTSVKKYKAMQNIICSDSRARGIHQYYGANRTGRWAGRLVQPQNMTKNSLKDLALARQLVREGDLEMLELIFGDVSSVLSELVRTSFIASPGNRFIVSDFSAIEARVIAWLAGEKWRLELFKNNGEIYEASAAQMFKVPVESIGYKDKNGNKIKGPNYDMRAKGKVAELACGFQGGPGALIRMGALQMGLKEEELVPLIKQWRNANKKIVQYWYDVDKASLEAMQEPGEVVKVGHVSFQYKNGCLWCALPSGRKLCYQQPKIVEGEKGDKLTYMGLDQTTKQWKRQDTYGGKLVENIVQATARDLLAEAMLMLDGCGYKIVLHVHDEIVVEEAIDGADVHSVEKIMGNTPQWAIGLPLAAEGYATEFYKKD